MQNLHGRNDFPLLVLRTTRLYFAAVSSMLLRALFQGISAMAAYQTSRAAPVGAATIYRLVSHVAEGLFTLRKWNDGRLTRSSLAGLSDRQLADIGLCRGDVDLIGR